jgi:hypothetical protein
MARHDLRRLPDPERSPDWHFAFTDPGNLALSRRLRW